MVSSSVRVLFIGLITTIMIGCGKDNEKSGDGTGQEQLQLSPAEQIMSEWNGVYNSMASGEPTDEAMAVLATFTSDFQFEISLEKDPSAKVLGTWSEFQSKTLILKISGSTISSLGAAGKIVEADFELLGNALKIQNKNFILRLTKKTINAPNNPGTGATNFFSGNWSCDGDGGRHSKITIDEKNFFKLSTFRPGERALVAVGSIGAILENGVTLAISSSSEALSSGSYFELQKSGSMTRLFFVNPGSPHMTLGNCSR